MASTNRYSLADCLVTIDFPGITDGDRSIPQRTFTIGGPGDSNEAGSYMGEIKITRAVEAFTTEGDYTGSYVHNRNLNKTGTVELTIRQVSDKILQLLYIANAYEGALLKNFRSSGKGLTITVQVGSNYNGVQDTFITCSDCMINKIPDQVYGETAATQDWTFTAGIIEYEPGKPFDSEE